MKNVLIEARFLKKLNRFVGIVMLEQAEHTVLIPNTGRLSELLIPGQAVLLLPYEGKHRYKLQYVFYKGSPVFIDSVASNKIFYGLLEGKKVPGMQHYSSVVREQRYGKHRFDFLVEDSGGNRSFIELKSCTLAWKNIAAFPDAPTERGSAHLEALRESGGGSVVFFILHSNIDYFVPDYHTDYTFYSTLVRNSETVNIAAYSVNYSLDYSINSLVPVKVILPDIGTGGSYMLVYFNNSAREIKTGGLGKIFFPEGYYVYTGSAKNDVFSRIAYHRRKVKRNHWHIDYIKDSMKLVRDVPIVNRASSECLLAGRLAILGGRKITGFGSSDCGCASHFYHFHSNPLESGAFWDFVLEERFGNLLTETV